jgi:protein SCO1/2
MRRYFLPPLLILLLCACSKGPAPWHGRNISGLMPNLAFTLSDDSAHPVHAERFGGSLVLLYFGYTRCKAACNATIPLLISAIRSLGSDAERVRLLFVSVDPQRDTPAALREYAAHFAPQLVALRGNGEQLQALSRRYRVAYSYGKPDTDGNYEVYHSSAIFTFDRHGRIRLLLRQQDGAAAIAADLRRLLAETA